jgi:hypothetical protein
MIDPGFDGRLGFVEDLETMLPDALKLERPYERFDDAVLLGRVRQDEFLAQPCGSVLNRRKSASSSAQAASLASLRRLTLRPMHSQSAQSRTALT